MRRLRAGLPYVALAEIGDLPNVMADGAALPSTVLTLSHWPGSPTPAALRHDLSAGIGFRYLRSRRRWPTAEAVTSDHFDQDGIVTVMALTAPDVAMAHEPELVAVAEAGDFVRGRSRGAARVSFSLASLAERRAAGGDGNPALSGGLHREALELLPDLLARPDHHAELWEEEDAFLAASEEALADGRVRISEVAALDLAVVEVRDPAPPAGRAAQFSHRREAAVHPMAVHNRTRRCRVLMLAAPRYELYFRYETWVQLASGRPAPRVDLVSLAGELSGLETSGTRWSFTGAGATVARLAPEEGAPSSLSPEVVLERAQDSLARGRPAWDPYAPRPG